jgi:hypothetical protein
MSDPVIVSHVATHEYRKRVDEMTCKCRGCKRWRVDGTSEYCQAHDPARIATVSCDGFVAEKERTP